MQILTINLKLDSDLLYFNFDRTLDCCQQLTLKHKKREVMFLFHHLSY
jgi:hypothetical protein